MIILTITYPATPGASFDYDYFESRHLPKVGKAFGPYGLNSASVLRGMQDSEGGDPGFLAMTLLNFSSEASAKDALKSIAAIELMDDIAKFTSVQPKMQFNLPYR